MDVDWGQAVQVGVVGFGLVFFVLAILAICMWLVGWFFDKSGNLKIQVKKAKKTKTDNKVEEIKIESIPEYKPRVRIEDFDRYE
jgi:Na+-transporting methylmalonyl-CoA/oxaloacetate decarboxylase gamma subunit